MCAQIQTRVSKMGRKLGLWLWLATQNMRDFDGDAKNLLAQIEMFICLALPPDEIDQIEKFKQLTPEARALILSARKEIGKFTEGVVITPKLVELIRNIPPRLFLVMAGTEKSEKNERQKIIKEFNCTEMEAIKIIAKRMMEKKVEVELDE